MDRTEGADPGRVCEATSSCLGSFNLTSANDLPESALKQQDDNVARFRIWAGNLGAWHQKADRRSADYRLRDAPEVEDRVVELLEELTEINGDIEEILSGSRANRGAVDIDGDPDDSESDGGQDELSELLLSVGDVITSLMKVSMLVRKATGRDRYVKASQARTDHQYLGEFDIRHVADRFTKARSQQWLLERLGGAITQRRQYLRYSRDHKNRIAHVDQREAHIHKHDHTVLQVPGVAIPAAQRLMPSARTVSTRPTLTPTTASTLQVEQLQPENLQNLDQDDDAVSQATSFVSSRADGERSEHLHVVRLQELAKTNEPFECPYCFAIVQAKRQRSWKKHVFCDLRAYTCTFQDCEAGLFGDRGAWWQHEMDVHRRQWSCQTCDKVFGSADALHNHLRQAHNGQAHNGQALPFELIAQIADANSRPVTEIAALDCPLCDQLEVDLRSEASRMQIVIPEGHRITTSLSKFQQHLGFHQEQLALFAIPPTIDGRAESGSKPSHHDNDREVQKQTLLQWQEEILHDDNEDTILSSTDQELERASDEEPSSDSDVTTDLESLKKRDIKFLTTAPPGTGMNPVANFDGTSPSVHNTDSTFIEEEIAYDVPRAEAAFVEDYDSDESISVPDTRLNAYQTGPSSHGDLDMTHIAEADRTTLSAQPTGSLSVDEELCHAILEDRGHKTRLPLFQGANPNARFPPGLKGVSVDLRSRPALLHVAIEENCPTAFEALILHLSTDINIVDDRGWSPLHCAANRNAIQFLALIFEHRSQDVQIDLLSNDGRTALSIAAGGGSTQAMTLLLKHNADPDQGGCLLHAVLNQQLQATRALISCGADVNITTAGYVSVLGAACARSNIEMLHLLLAEGANIDAVGSPDDSAAYGTPLVTAITRASAEAVNLLIAAGADIRLPGPRGDPLSVARAERNANTATAGVYDEIISALESRLGTTVYDYLDSGSFNIADSTSPSGSEGNLFDLHTDDETEIATLPPSDPATSIVEPQTHTPWEQHSTTFYRPGDVVYIPQQDGNRLRYSKAVFLRRQGDDKVAVRDWMTQKVMETSESQLVRKTTMTAEELVQAESLRDQTVSPDHTNTPATKHGVTSWYNLKHTKLAPKVMAAFEKRLTGTVTINESFGTGDRDLALSYAAFLKEFRTPTLRYSIERDRRLEEIIRMFYTNSSLALQQNAPPGDETWKAAVEQHAASLLRLLVDVLSEHGWSETRPQSLELLGEEIDRMLSRAEELRQRYSHSVDSPAIDNARSGQSGEKISTSLEAGLGLDRTTGIMADGPNIVFNLESMLSMSDTLLGFIETPRSGQLPMGALPASLRRLNYSIEILLENLRSMTLEELGFESGAQRDLIGASTIYLFGLQGAIDLMSQADLNDDWAMFRGELASMVERANAFAATLSPLRGRTKRPQEQEIDTVLKNAKPPTGLPDQADTKTAEGWTPVADEVSEHLIGISAWFAAVHRNGLFGLKKLLDEGFDVDQRDSNMYTALHHAATRGNLDMTKLLVDAKADLSLPLPQGNTALHIAAREGHVDVVTCLLDNGSRVNARNWIKETPLALAIQGRTGKPHLVVKELLKNGASTRVSRDSTILEVSLLGDREESESGLAIMAQLLDADPGLVSILDDVSRPPLHTCVRKRWMRYVDCLLQYGADPNLRDRGGSRPLDLLPSAWGAWDSKCVTMYKSLTGAGADPRDAGPKLALLLQALQGYNILDSTFTFEESTSVDVETEERPDDLSASLEGGKVIEYGRVGTLEQGRTIDAPNSEPRPSRDAHDLFDAIERSDDLAVFLALHEGVDPDSTDNTQTPALALAAAKENLGVLEVLHEHKADPNLRDAKGRTALHHAAMFGRVANARYLLDCGAEISSHDAAGDTPFVLAARTGASVAMLELFVEAGIYVPRTILHTLLRNNPDPLPSLEYLLDTKPWLINAAVGVTNETPLQIAVANISRSCTLALLARGADVNVVSDDGTTPMLALLRKEQASEGEFDLAAYIFEDLCDHGCTVDEATLSEAELSRYGQYVWRMKLNRTHRESHSLDPREADKPEAQQLYHTSVFDLTI